MAFCNLISRGWNQFFFRGFSGESLGLLRMYIGCGLLFFHTYQFATVLTLNPIGSRNYFLDPIWYFHLLGIQYHIPALSFIVYALLMTATVGMIMGKWTRTSILVVILCIFYLKGVRDSFSGDVHHRYIIPMQMLFLFLLSRCGEVHSRDSRHHTYPPLKEWEASWPIKMMQLYVALFYFWSVIAKVRVSGWEWFSGEGRIQEVLIKRSVRWGMTGEGELVKNSLSFELAQRPDLIQIFSHLVLAFELGFPLILFIQSVKLRAFFLSGVVIFHISSFILMDVNFLLIPFVYLIFFDLVPIHQWLQVHAWRFFKRRPSMAG
ncbi:hypothetical protein [Candidatus Nitrospira neomarina]|uniref:HTTM domain-containing protein n=1 Tax=Candidatus Nitrospira neomarina TaxID=3020899 RepID=A0AA96K3A5_9BACT|nr:hypothetical protein [Candidatus Nitrospira neomarina]WNM62399.1 hypothetical protein PQG83_01250 [Candidatus Nitrospira neomarina]